VSAHNDFPESALTPWFPLPHNPSRPGVYRTSREDILVLGSAYSYWNGERWENFKNWGAYHGTVGFVWRGLNHERRIPLEGGSLE